MFKSGFAFVLSHIDVKCDGSIEIIPDHYFRKAHPQEITQIIDMLENFDISCEKMFKLPVNRGIPYDSIVKILGGSIIHLIQCHAHSKRGEITISKYEKLGPHYLHYKIYTHWKAFYRDKHELKLKWEIKLIKGRVQKKRGRPPKAIKSQKADPKWRQKFKNFQTSSFKKKGTAKVYINFSTNKVSMRAGSKKWMVQILNPLLKIFKGKHATSNLVESKHAQIKGGGAGRKQKDKLYGHQLFRLLAFLVERGYLPFTSLAGRPLYKYLMKEKKKKEVGYKIMENKHLSVQTVLSAF